MLPLTARVAPRSFGTSDPVYICRAKGEDVAQGVWVWSPPPLRGGGGAAKSPHPISWTPTGASPPPAPSLCCGLNLGRQSPKEGGGG